MKKYVIYLILAFCFGICLSIFGYYLIERSYQQTLLAVSEASPELTQLILTGHIVSLKLWWPIVLYFVMIMGMVFSIGYAEASSIYSKSGEIEIGNLFQSIIFNPCLWKAMFVSPFVFYVTYLLVKEIPEGIVSIFYAFQNGFFWHSIFGMFRRADVSNK